MKRVLPLLAVALVGCVPPTEPTEQPPTEQPAADTDYTKWPSVTAEPHVVEPSQPTLCDINVSGVVKGWDPAAKWGTPQDRSPHADHAINVRVNPTGREAFLARKPVPVGTVVVKEKLTNGKVVAVGTMTKREAGYDPEYGDWEYSYRELKADALPATVGKIESCIACHRTVKQKDYLFRPYLPTILKK